MTKKSKIIIFSSVSLILITGIYLYLRSKKLSASKFADENMDEESATFQDIIDQKQYLTKPTTKMSKRGYGVKEIVKKVAEDKLKQKSISSISTGRINIVKI